MPCKTQLSYFLFFVFVCLHGLPSIFCSPFCNFSEVVQIESLLKANSYNSNSAFFYAVFKRGHEHYCSLISDVTDDYLPVVEGKPEICNPKRDPKLLAPSEINDFLFDVDGFYSVKVNFARFKKHFLQNFKNLFRKQLTVFNNNK